METDKLIVHAVNPVMLAKLTSMPLKRKVAYFKCAPLGLGQ